MIRPQVLAVPALLIASLSLAACGKTEHPLPANTQALAGSYTDDVHNVSVTLGDTGFYVRTVWNGDTLLDDHGTWSSGDGVVLTLEPEGKDLPTHLTVVSTDELRNDDGTRRYLRR